MFGLFRKRSNPAREAVRTASEFAESLIGHFGHEAFRDDPMAPQALTAYVFGGVSVDGKERGLSMAEIQAVHIAFLCQYCGIAEERAGALSVQLMQAMTERDPQSELYWLYKVVHRGIDGFLAWREGKVKRAGRDFAEVVEALNAGRDSE